MANENKIKQGWVYVLTNPEMKGIVKIGQTQSSVEERAKQLYTTGVPQPYQIFYQCFFQNCEQAEKQVHEFLKKYRVKENNADREFFRVSPEMAMQVVDRFFYQEKFAQYDQRIQHLEKENGEKGKMIQNLKDNITEQHQVIKDLKAEVFVNQSVIEVLIGKVQLNNDLSERGENLQRIEFWEIAKNAISAQINPFNDVSWNVTNYFFTICDKLKSHYKYEEEKIEEDIEDLKRAILRVQPRIDLYNASEEEREFINTINSYQALFHYTEEEPMSDDEFTDQTRYVQRLQTQIQTLQTELETLSKKIMNLEREIENWTK